jgi:DNA-binding GntR family transcriptional regulator
MAPVATLPIPSLIGDRSLKREVYALIVALIHHGELRPGDRISEADVAARLGISRAPVREAFAELVHEGLIVRKPRFGSFVAQLTSKDLDDIADARVMIECHAARRACLRVTAADADELHGLIAAMAETAADERRWTEVASLNARFHQTVARIADNPILERLWRTLDPLAWLLAPAVRPHKPHDPADLVARHERLLEALLSGNPDQASAAFEEHIRGAAHRAPLPPLGGSRPPNERPPALAGSVDGATGRASR